MSAPRRFFKPSYAYSYSYSYSTTPWAVATIRRPPPRLRHLRPWLPSRIRRSACTRRLDVTAPSFGDALLDELTGDDVAARAGFERVLAASDAPPALAARAALHLAQLEARAGKTRRALDLVARATALAPSDLVIAEGVGAAGIRGRRRVARATSADRGSSTPLPGVDPKVAERVRRRRARARARASNAIASVHRSAVVVDRREGERDGRSRDRVPGGRRARRPRADRVGLPHREPVSRPRRWASCSSSRPSSIRMSPPGCAARCRSGDRAISTRPSTRYRACLGGGGDDRGGAVAPRRRDRSARRARSPGAAIHDVRVDRRRPRGPGRRQDLGVRSRLALRRRCVRGAAHVERSRRRAAAPPRSPVRDASTRYRSAPIAA